MMEGVRYGMVRYHIIHWKEYGMVRYGTISYGTVPEISFSQEFQNPTNCVLQDPGPRFFGPANFTGPKLREQ
jgi:hypothetical protein